MTVLKLQKTYPLLNGTYQLFFEFMPGSEVLGLCLLEKGKKYSIKLGNYSVEQALWLTKNQNLQLPDELLEEILIITKGVAYARAAEYSRKSRLKS